MRTRARLDPELSKLREAADLDTQTFKPHSVFGSVLLNPLITPPASVSDIERRGDCDGRDGAENGGGQVLVHLLTSEPFIVSRSQKKRRLT